MQTTITLLQTSDLHGYIYPYSYADHSQVFNGLARISSAIKEIRDKNTIVIDTGDTLQGSAYTYYHSLQNDQSPSPMASLMNHISFDYLTVGNHDFNYGKDYLKTYNKHSKAVILANNIYENGHQLFTPYKIHIIDGIRIGIIGTTTQHIPHWESKNNIKDITFKHVLAATRESVDAIKNQVDAIVVSYHGGFEADLETGIGLKNETGENCGYQLIKEIPEIDVLLTGHQHRSLSGRLNNCVYTQPGINGSHLGIVTLDFKQTKTGYQLTHSKSKLLAMTNIEPDSKIEELAQVVEDKVQVWLDQELGHLVNGDLLIHDPLKDRIHKHPLVQFINQVQMEASGADISSTSLGNDIKGFKQAISLRDVIATYVYPNTLVVLKMSGKILKEALEKSAEFFSLSKGNIIISPHFLSPKVELYNYDMYDGIDYTIDLNQGIGHRIIDLNYKDHPIDPRKDYEVVMNNYRSAGGGNFTMFEHAVVDRTIEMDIVDLLANYIRQQGSIFIDYKDNIKIKS